MSRAVSITPWYSTAEQLPDAERSVIGIRFWQHYQVIGDVGLYRYHERGGWWDRLKGEFSQFPPTHWCYAPDVPDERRRRGG